MPEDHPGNPQTRRWRPPNLFLWLLFVGLVISLARNLHQDQRIDGLVRDLASIRQDTQRQLAELREAQSASLEQDLRRLDQLTKQLQKTSVDVMHEATSEVNRTRSELAKTVEQRHQEMITELSALRSDLSVNSSASLSQPSREPPKDSSETERVRAKGTVAKSTLVSNSSNQPAAVAADGEGEFKFPEGAPGTGTSGVSGIRTVVLKGDPDHAGPYTIVLRIPALTRIDPHVHRDDRVTTVVSGIWYIGYGDVFKKTELKAQPPGSSYAEPANRSHFAETRDSPVIVRITGVGPSSTSYVEAASESRRGPRKP
jgi:hypothetical protein